MHEKLVELIVAKIRKRVSEGDCPIDPPLSVEQYEEVILSLAASPAAPVPATVKAYRQAVLDAVGEQVQAGADISTPRIIYRPRSTGEIKAAINAIPLPAPVPAEGEGLQARVVKWGKAAFGAQMAVETSLSVLAERNHRFLEEALELVQAAGCSKHEALQLVGYVFARPVGELEQEVGGVMMCIALLCHKQGINMDACAEKELARIWTKIDAIRAKRAAKPEFGPLPGFANLPTPPREGE